ncbi:MAG: TM0106 family RecB-like putative nuclease [Planctomycetaceae bacterium]|nr:TM0106 family RecB-like putative nuclease [Planctomycetaceae bacterium]
MKVTDGTLWFSPTDLIRYMESPFASWMDRLHLERPGRLTPDESDPELRLYADAGNRHEEAFLNDLEEQQSDVCRVPETRPQESLQATRDAMAAGREIIYQAYLELPPFAGYADFLSRVATNPVHYEVWDTKLAKKPKPYYLVQLCCYAEMLEAVQGRRPAQVEVILGDGSRKRFRTDDYWFYYQQLKSTFLDLMDAFDPEGDHPVPDPRAQHGRWQSHAEQWLLDRDHLYQVANISVSQIEKLNRAEICTLSKLARSGGRRVPRLHDDTYRRLSDQAAIQLLTRQKQDAEQEGHNVPPAFRVLSSGTDDSRLGLSQLPPSSTLDVFFDIEGYPLIGDGLEYLLGAVTVADGVPSFHDWWAHDEREEKRAFEQFIDWIVDHWNRDPTMHVYHYAPYEVSAMRRLMGRYGTREDEVDDLLRAGVFVDLFRVVRQSILLGAPDYSLKSIEKIYTGPRDGNVKTAGASMVYYAQWLASGESGDWRDSKILKEIRDYNEVDCISTWQAARWLWQLQEQHGVQYRPRKKATDEEEQTPTPNETANRRTELARRLHQQIPTDPGERAKDSERWRIQEMLADLVGYHRREAKPVWWAFFDRQEMSEVELIEELNCLGGLQRTPDAPEAIKRSLGFWYSFDPDQDTKIRIGDRVCLSHDTSVELSVEQFDPRGSVQLKISQSALTRLPDRTLPDRVSVIPKEGVSTEVIDVAIENMTEAWEAEQKLPQAFRRFLLRLPPSIAKHRKGAPLVQHGEDAVSAAVRISAAMQESTLCIQGPPGTGKTYTAAQMIAALLEAGKNIGVTSNSHEAILNVMDACFQELGDNLSAIKAGGDAEHPIFTKYDQLQHIDSGSKAAAAYQGGLIGGSAWLFSHPEMEGRLDYLFVDEAGQVSIAKLAGMSRSTSNIVLIGDQMQLSQPTQGTHPRESGQSLLEYLLQDHAVIPEDLGIFLDVTRRMHPDVCSFISGAIYEGRLHAHEDNVNRIICPGLDLGEESLAQAGIRFVGVGHTGNVQSSDEEAARIVELTRQLLQCDHTDRHGQNLGRLQLEDILFVAPYNLQVRNLAERLPAGARVGSVDKFQGQQAPVVIISMCSSAGDFGSRGLKFLLNKNRVNVAISRAQTLAVIVGDPGIAQTGVSSVPEMELVNLYCRLLQH